MLIFLLSVFSKLPEGHFFSLIFEPLTERDLLSRDQWEHSMMFLLSYRHCFSSGFLLIQGRSCLAQMAWE